VASGGHSHIIEVLSYTSFRVVGKTRDDAAGECFDKCARALGFPYPGGVHIDKASASGNPDTYKLPVPRVAGNAYDFSFSGLKTAVINTVHNAAQKGIEINVNDMAASVQKTISEMLVSKTIMAAEETGYNKIVLAGGVSANSGIRAALEKACKEKEYELFMPPLSLCGDNAAMIACQGYYNYQAGITADESLNAVATMSVEKLGVMA
jgi:N6-L-threonylcarbamoyladenine synthase